MGQYVKLEVTKRDETGSKAVRALRAKGLIPAIYYFHGEDNVNLELNHKAFMRTLHSGQHIFEMDLDGKQIFVMIKAVQYHPVTDEIIHVDILRVRRSEKMTISVPLVLEGDALGIKEGGVLSQTLNSLEINCLPTDVPENIVFDVTELGINESLHVSDITPGENMDIVTSPELVFVSIQPPSVEVEPEEIEPEFDEDGEEIISGDSEEEDGQENDEESEESK